MATVRAALVFYWRQFLTGYCTHLLLPALLLLLFGLFTGQVGVDYGVRYLVAHQDPGKQFVVGCALAALALNVLFTGYLL